MRRLYQDIVAPSLAPLVAMTVRGMRVDKKRLEEARKNATEARDRFVGEVLTAAQPRLPRVELPGRGLCDTHPDPGRGKGVRSCPVCAERRAIEKQWKEDPRVKEALRLQDFDPTNKNHVRWLLEESYGLTWPARGRTETGLASVKIEFLKELLEMRSTPNAAVQLIRDLISLAHLQTRLNVFLAPPLDEDGVAHPNYTLEGTSVGRIRSGAVTSDPDKTGSDDDFNAQNIPEDVRSIYVPSPKCVFIELDAAQIEWVLTMVLARSKRGLSAYREQRDIHSENLDLLAGVFGWEWKTEKERKAWRKVSKSFTHSTDYGEGAFNLARRMRMPQKVAEEAQQKYFEAWPEVRKWQEEVEQHAIECRYIQNPFGRKRRFFDVTGKSKGGRKQLVLAGKQLKEALAFGPASTNADLWKIGLRKLYDAERRVGFKLVTGTHDSFLVECRDTRADITRVAEAATDLLQEPVPEFADIIGRDDWRPRYEAKVGASWGEMEPLS